jgi:hypothetical protein
LHSCACLALETLLVQLCTPTRMLVPKRRPGLETDVQRSGEAGLRSVLLSLGLCALVLSFAPAYASTSSATLILYRGLPMSMVYQRRVCKNTNLLCAGIRNRADRTQYPQNRQRQPWYKFVTGFFRDRFIINCRCAQPLAQEWGCLTMRACRSGLKVSQTLRAPRATAC